MMSLTVNGTPYTDFIRASVTVRLDALANEFRFTASAVDNFPPIKYNDDITVTVENVVVLSGYVEIIEGQDAEGGHMVTYSGRDYTGDFVDGQINVLNDLRATGNLTLKQIIESVISSLGLSLKVVDNANPAPFNSAEDIITPSVGESALDFVMKYAKKRQVLLSSTPDGNILITNSSPTDSGAALQRLQGSDSNNIISQDWIIDGAQLFNKYISRGQLDPVASNFAGSTNSKSIEDQGGESTDNNVRTGRQKVTVETQSYSSEQLKDRAKWMNQLSKSKALRFNCVSRGHTNSSGIVWAVNKLVQIDSDSADINRKMLLNTVTFSEGNEQPTISTLGFVDQDVYTIEAAVLAQKPVGSFSSAFGGAS